MEGMVRLVGFITSESGFSLKESNYLEPKSPIPIVLVIGVLFFLLNYVVIMPPLEFLSRMSSKIQCQLKTKYLLVKHILIFNS